MHFFANTSLSGGPKATIDYTITQQIVFEKIGKFKKIKQRKDLAFAET